MHRRTLQAAALLAALLAPAAFAQQPTASQLFTSTDPSAPVDDSAFTTPAGARPPSQVFEGSLDLQPPPGYGHVKLVSTTFPAVRAETLWHQLPAFHVDLIQDGPHLIPVQQGLILTGSLAWNLIVGPGAAWDQDGDRGYTRAALPFALIERGQNCVHNGELTFLFSDHPHPAISQVRYQITQETCYYLKADFWGQVPAVYTPHAVPDAAALKADFASELAHRVPSKPFAELATDFPGARLDLAAFLRGRKHPEDVTTYGVYVNGIHYASNCPTRHGEYAFCDQMRLPSYSTAKSAFTGVALMHLGQMYGPGVYTQRLAPYLPNVGQDKTWNDITLTNAVDMATGHFLDPGFEHDEDHPETKFLVDESLDAKLKDALLTFPAKAAPGTVFNYQSHNFFLAAVVMDAILKQKRGPRADLFDLIADDIYKPLQVSAGMLSSIRTGNSATGVAEGYFGLFYIQDDVVKLARFLDQGTGEIDGHPVLDPQRLRESLFRDPANLGLPTTDPRQLPGTVRYNHSFWARHFTAAQYPQLSCDVWTPYMSGYGGISIVMLPNGVVFYVFSDAEEFVFNDAILETNKLVPLCPAKP